MAEQKRNRIKMFAVTLGYLVAYRVALAFIGVIALVIYMLHLGIHDPVAIKQHMTTDFGQSFAVLAVVLTWGGRLAIVMAARKGMLPGTEFPGQDGEYASVFADAAPIPARRLAEPLPTPRTYAEPQAPARKVFGTRGTTAAQG